MTPEEVGAALVTALGHGAEAGPEVATASISGGGRWARATVDVPPASWITSITAARDALGCNFFDWLSAVDELDQGYAIVAHVWSTAGRYGVLVRTRVPRDAPALESIVDIYPGAAWHERETYEMFGVDFPGHPHLVPLLLPPEFEGHPLRKEFVLASRVAKPWPGAKEPGEREERAPASPAVASERRSGEREEAIGRRQPMRPPGVPAPGECGPDARRGGEA
jgi:NADH-quinone oxidoreductase subunit C